MQLRNGIYYIFVLFILNILPNTAYAVNPFDKWFTLNTPHFQIHHLKDQQVLAEKTAMIAESVYSDHEKFFNWTIKDPVSIVLNDSSDLANGWATPIPFNNVNLYLTPPDDAAGIEDFDDWYYLLIRHELTHTFHADKAAGYIKSLRNVFGRFLLLFPNALQPAWFLEGIATYQETDTTKQVGRGQSSGFEMMMRTEVSSGLMPVDQLNLPPASWPFNKHYLYGVYFYQFLVDEFGIYKVQELIEKYSDNLLPFAINTNAKQVLGRDLTLLWVEFSNYLENRFKKQVDQLNTTSVQNNPILDDQAITLTSIRSHHDGNENKLYYLANDFQSPAMLTALNSDGSKQELVELHRNSHFDLLADKGLIIAMPDYCDENNLYYDLYRYEFDTDSLDKITDCSRYKWVSSNKTGNQLVAIKTVNGIPQIDLLSAQGNLIETIWTGTLDDVLSHIEWSHDNKHLLVSRKIKHRSWDIYEIEISTGRWQVITFDHDIDMQPQYSDDGNSILYISDRTGVYNIYLYDRQSKTERAITHVITGAFYPVQTQPDSIAYLEYSPEGFQLRKASIETTEPVNIKPAWHDSNSDDTYSYEINTDETNYTITDYSPWGYLKPKYWFPYISIINESTEFGFFTSSNDALGLHYYDALLSYGIDQQELLGRINYSYHHWLLVNKTKLNTAILDSQGNTLRIFQNDSSQVILNLPFTSVDRQWGIQYGLIRDHDSEIYRDSSLIPAIDAEDNVSAIGIYYNDSKYFPGDNSQSHGRSIRLINESSDVYQSDYSGQLTSLDWREYLSIGKHHTLGVRLFGARGDSGIRQLSLGGHIESSQPLNYLSPVVTGLLFNKRVIALRGYPEHFQTGNNLDLLTLEWRMPVNQVEKGIMAPPIGIMQNSARLFAESGSAWVDTAEADYISSVGAEWITDFNLFYNIPIKLRLGYAKGLDDGGEDQVYLTAGGSF